MARVGGILGAVSFISGHNADIASFNLAFTHPVDDDTSYSDVSFGSSHAGSGTLDYNLTCAGFLKANVSNSSPGFDDVTAAGGAVTLTSKTGCTHTGTFILTGGSIDHRKRAGAIPVSYQGVNDGDVSETWAVS